MPHPGSTRSWTDVTESALSRVPEVMEDSLRLTDMADRISQRVNDLSWKHAQWMEQQHQLMSKAWVEAAAQWNESRSDILEAIETLKLLLPEAKTSQMTSGTFDACQLHADAVANGTTASLDKQCLCKELTCWTRCPEGDLAPVPDDAKLDPYASEGHASPCKAASTKSIVSASGGRQQKAKKRQSHAWVQPVAAPIADDIRAQVLAGERVRNAGGRESFLQEDPDSDEAPSGPPGRVRALARHILSQTYFECGSTAAIFMDTLIIGVEASQTVQAGRLNLPWVKYVSAGLKMVFVLEVLLRFTGWGIVNSLRVSGWMRFDTAMAFLSMGDIIITEALQGEEAADGPAFGILRLLRVCRLVRTVRLWAELRSLWLLISGLWASGLTIIWTFLLILSLSYIYAIIGMEGIASEYMSVFADDEEFSESYDVATTKFGSLGDAMLTNLQVLTFDSIGAIYRPLIMKGPLQLRILCTIYFTSFILIGGISLMHLVTAVMVEACIEQANEDKESMRAMEERKKQKLLPVVREMFYILDCDGDGEITWDEIENAPEEMKVELSRLANTNNLNLVFTLLDDDDSGRVQIDEFLDGLMNASVGDGNVLVSMGIVHLVRQLGTLKHTIDPSAGVRASELRLSVENAAFDTDVNT